MIRRDIVRWLLFLAAVSLLPGFIGSAAADDTDLDVFLDRIQQVSDTVHSFSCSFSQEKRLALFSAPVSFQGKLYIDRPDKLRWEFIAPVPSALLFDGNEGRRCDDQMASSRFNLATDPVMSIVAKQLWLWLGGDYQGIDKLYSLEKEGASTLVVTPTDNDTGQYISSVRISFDEMSLQPRKVEISEAGGDLTIIAFHDPVINTELAVTLFKDCRNE